MKDISKRREKAKLTSKDDERYIYVQFCEAIIINYHQFLVAAVD